MNLMVAGCGTDVGKTIVSAIITMSLQANYWKPIQCGHFASSDTNVMKQLINTRKHTIFKPAYSFINPVSPHHAARLEQVTIDINSISLPKSDKRLIIEGVGGVLVPLLNHVSTFDLFKSWNCKWIIVSRHYLGSINHTLLTIELLKQHGCCIGGLIFNGLENSDSEKAILAYSGCPFLGRLFPEEMIDKPTIKRYAKLWQHTLQTL